MSNQRKEQALLSHHYSRAKTAGAISPVKLPVDPGAGFCCFVVHRYARRIEGPGLSGD
jgi:hypothetical protein